MGVQLLPQIGRPPPPGRLQLNNNNNNNQLSFLFPRPARGEQVTTTRTHPTFGTPQLPRHIHQVTITRAYQGIRGEHRQLSHLAM